MKCIFFSWFDRRIDANYNKEKENSNGWTPLLFLICFATTLGAAVPVGYFLGIMNTLADFIKTWSHNCLLSNYDIDLSESEMEVLWATFVSIFLVGGVIGSVIMALCGNRYGRKSTLLASAVLMIGSGFLLHFCRAADSIEMLLLGRFLAGISSAFIYATHSMYLLEIAPAKLRGTVGVFCAVGVTIGIVVGQVFSLHQVFGTESDWPYALSSYTFLVVVCFAPCCWFPESPRWLYLVKGNKILAAAELAKLRGTNAEESITIELTEMEASNKAELAANEGHGKTNIMSVLRDPELLLPLIIVCSYQLCQQLSGINAIFFYSMDIFTKAGFSNANAAWMNLGAGCLNLIVSLLGPWLMARFNRRPLMLLSCSLCGCSLLGTTFSLYYINNASWIAIVCIIFIAAFVVFFQFGLGPIPYFIGSEIFEVAPRSVAMSIGSLCSWIGNFTIAMGFPLLKRQIDAFAFLPCAVMCIYGFLLTWYYLAESRGRDAKDVKLLMANGLKSRVS